MKIYPIYLGAFLISLTMACNGQEDDVPEVVREAFALAHPGIEDVEWEVEDGMYEVEYEEDGLEKETLFSPDGEEIETTVELEDEDVPEEVMRALRKDYPNWEIDDIDKVMIDGEVAYEIEVENEEGMEIELAYSAQGVILKREVEDEG